MLFSEPQIPSNILAVIVVTTRPKTRSYYLS